MTKKEIITLLEKRGIEHNPKERKADLVQLLPSDYCGYGPGKATGKAKVTGTVECRQKGCPDAHDNDGFCSVCGHPLTE